MINVKQTWLSEEPQEIEMLRNLPEGSRIPNFEPEYETYLLLGIEGKNEESQLVLLTEDNSGNPIKEYYPLKGVRYYREDNQPNIIALPRGFGASRPRQEAVLFNSEDYERYSKMLKGVTA